MRPSSTSASSSGMRWVKRMKRCTLSLLTPNSSARMSRDLLPSDLCASCAPSEVGALPLALHRLKPHRISERPLARQDGLPLEVAVYHGDDGLVVAHVPHDAGDARKARQLGRPLPAMPGSQARSAPRPTRAPSAARARRSLRCSPPAAPSPRRLSPGREGRERV